MVGDGPERKSAEEFALFHGLRNITFIDWLDHPALVEMAAHADVILGAFGNTPQSLMTIQNKIYAGLAMAKPVITTDWPGWSGRFRAPLPEGRPDCNG